MTDFLHHILASIAAIDYRHGLVTIVAFIVLLGIMVVVHEFGHFAVAKLCKVRVEAFSVGFGPRLFGVQYGDTEYKVCALPLGGYVKMSGEEFAELTDAASGTAVIAPPTDPGALNNHPRWQRMLIAVAGPVANFVLAFVLMVIYFGWINEVPSINPIVVEWVSDGSAAAQAGIQTGDIIRHFATIDNPSWTQIETSASKNVNQAVPVIVDRDGKSLSLSFHVITKGKTKGRALSDSGLFLQLVKSPIKVDTVVSGQPAAQAGLRDKDLILAVDGHAFHTLDPMVAYLQSGNGKPITLSVNRNGQMIAPIVVQPTDQGSAWRIGFTYVPPTGIPVQLEPMKFSDSVADSTEFCVGNSTMILDVLGRILTHKVSATQLTGPVGIAQAAGQAAETKEWASKFGLAASISLNLGIVNLLPFPILDGGMILFLLIEGTIRRDININVKERIYQGAFVLLVGLFAFLIINDVSHLSFFAHLKQ
jgi:regulator of sigma E protease